MDNTKTWKHLAAFIYDIFPVLAIILLTSLLILIVRNGVMVERHTLWFDILIVLEIALYFTYSWKVGGQTLGMRAWKIKIICKDGTQQISWKQSILRLAIGTISTLLLGLGLWWKLFSKHKSSWMDLASNSKTISES